MAEARLSADTLAAAAVNLRQLAAFWLDVADGPKRRPDRPYGENFTRNCVELAEGYLRKAEQFEAQAARMRKQ